MLILTGASSLLPGAAPSPLPVRLTRCPAPSRGRRDLRHGLQHGRPTRARRGDIRRLSAHPAPAARRGREGRRRRAHQRWSRHERPGDQERDVVGLGQLGALSAGLLVLWNSRSCPCPRRSTHKACTATRSTRSPPRCPSGRPSSPRTAASSITAAVAPSPSPSTVRSASLFFFSRVPSSEEMRHAGAIRPARLCASLPRGA